MNMHLAGHGSRRVHFLQNGSKAIVGVATTSKKQNIKKP